MEQKNPAPVYIEPWSPTWHTEFLRLQAMLTEALGDLILKIEHVGSTSVEGLPAKPILDIDVVIDTDGNLPAVIRRLEALGFVHEGNLGVEGREAFKRTIPDDFMPYHLYVCPKDGKGYLEHIAFRDYLRSHPEDALAYGELKMLLAEQYRHDRQGYTLAKTDFCRDILKKAGYGDAQG